MTPIVLDASALAALFRADPFIWDYWRQADAGTLTLIMPAAAIADAEQDLQAGPDAWSGILWAPGAEVAALTETVALHSGSWRGSIATRQVIYEAREFRSPVLTRTPEHYSPGRVPLLVF